MKKTTRRVLLAVLIAVFLVSGGMMLRQLGDYQQGDETYGSAESLAGLRTFPPSPGRRTPAAAAPPPRTPPCPTWTPTPTPWPPWTSPPCGR